MGLFGKTEKEIQKVKLLGIRTAEQTKVLSTHNFSIFCLLVQYVDETRELVECEAKDFQNKYMSYIEM